MTTNNDDTNHPHNIDPAAYGLKGQLSQMVIAANRDPNAVSLLNLGSDESLLVGALVVIKGDETLREFKAWATLRGHFTPETPSYMGSVLEPGERSELPGSCSSPPMVCPCSEPNCTQSCVEIGCRRHPTAGLRAFVYDKHVGLMCSECSDTIAAIGPKLPLCASHARNRSNIN